MVCRSLDDTLRDLKTTADDLWFQGKAPAYMLLMDARSKLLEARRLADFIADAADYDEPSFEVCISVADMATNFLSGTIRSA